MKAFISLLFLCASFGFVNSSLNPPSLQLSILDKNIKSGKYVHMELKNNTKSNLCIVVDTAYYNSNENYNNGEFTNFKIFLKDSKGNDLPIIREIKDAKLDVDTIKIKANLNRFSTSFRIIVLKSNKTFRIKVPFNLVTKFLLSNTHEYYDINKKKKYKGSLFYSIDKAFIINNIAKKTIDSIQQKGYRFFVGKLNSNEVPLVFK